MNKKIMLAAIAALAFSLNPLRADDPPAGKLPPASDRKDVTYEKDIKPIFEESCVKCHKGEKPKGKLNLTSLEGAMKGGKDGKVIEPGKSSDSMLVLAVAHMTDDDMDYMPPRKNKAGIKQLTPEQIGLIRAWIDQGAK
jgi:mono/diheme cytochrome c family protein